ncbi:hypothetical protein HHK36_030032 [Tetracentron sinense]|uniref:Uncharacterized protein n=1 Tax=Tetracentron sinense TaxID=13715 RepID=A0A834YAJ4_TETSI|nr:hypothetical protein HHK36_030032 [Tetracentron sinense]
MITDKASNAIGGKTARACDSCLGKRARWYCAADDAFLCQECDASVHSANPLARRHGRVRLKTASFKPTDEASVENSLPSWHHGFTRKARTPRHPKSAMLQPKAEAPMPNPLVLVPEMGSDEPSLDENEEQLLFRVPIFEPFVAEFYTSGTQNEGLTTANNAETASSSKIESKVKSPEHGRDGIGEVDNLPVFLPTDMDLAEFSIDVESLLGSGLDEDSFGIEGLGLLDCKEEDTMECCFPSGIVKVEEDMEASAFDPELDLNFDHNSSMTEEEEEEEKAAAMRMKDEYKAEEKTRISLRLDYEAVITNWANQGSPWITGDRPQINPEDRNWLDCMGTYPTDIQLRYVGGHVEMGDGGREARVSRYKEKRRTRLFSKKIRYEVRKLNAEKRPRMKGRFVKRACFAGTAFP